MSDNDPIRLPVSAFRRGGGVLKIKRGGTGKRSSSGTLQTRYHAPIRAVRDFRKPSKRHNGEFRVQPKVPDSPPIWNPLDPLHKREKP